MVRGLGFSPNLQWDTRKLRDAGIAPYNRNAPKGSKISLKAMSDMQRLGYAVVFAAVTHQALNHKQMLECFEAFGGNGAFCVGMNGVLLKTRGRTVSFAPFH